MKKCVKCLKPRWLQIAENELGTEEIIGYKHEQRILEYHETTTLSADDDETPWCSSFVNWCFEKVPISGTGSARARSWNKWGTRLEIPAFGCVVVMSRGRNPAFGHVGFFCGFDKNGDVMVLGGNQSNKVSIASYQISRVLSFRWPKT